MLPFVAALAEFLGEVVAAGGGLAFFSICNCLRSFTIRLLCLFKGFVGISSCCLRDLSSGFGLSFVIHFVVSRFWRS